MDVLTTVIGGMFQLACALAPGLIRKRRGDAPDKSLSPVDVEADQSTGTARARERFSQSRPVKALRVGLALVIAGLSGLAATPVYVTNRELPTPGYALTVGILISIATAAPLLCSIRRDSLGAATIGLTLATAAVTSCLFLLGVHDEMG